MKKSKSKLILFLLMLMICNNVHAIKMKDLVDSNDTIIQCDYVFKSGDEVKDTIYLQLKGTNVTNTTLDDFEWFMNIGGAQADPTKEIYIMGEKLPEDNVFNIYSSIEYTINNLKCPSYLGYYKSDKKYALTSTKPQNATKVYELSNPSQVYNKNYCYYTFGDKGLIIKNDPNILNQLRPFDKEILPSTCSDNIIVPINLYWEYQGEYDLYVYPVTQKDPNMSMLKDVCSGKTSEGIDPTLDYNCSIGKRTLKDIDENGHAGEDKSKVKTLEEINCDVIFDDETKKFISDMYFWIEVVAIVLTVIITAKDYAFAILNSNNDAMKKTNGQLITRIIIIVIILILPLVVKTIFKIVKIEGINATDPLCGTVNK